MAPFYIFREEKKSPPRATNSPSRPFSISSPASFSPPAANTLKAETELRDFIVSDRFLHRFASVAAARHGLFFPFPPVANSHRQSSSSTEDAEEIAAIQTWCWTHMGRDDRLFCRFLAERTPRVRKRRSVGWVAYYRG